MFEKIKAIFKSEDAPETENEKTEEAKHLIKSVMAQYPDEQQMMSFKLMDVMKFVKEKNLHPVIGIYMLKGMEYIMADALKGLIEHAKEEESEPEERQMLFEAILMEIDNISSESFRAIAEDELTDETRDKVKSLLAKHDCESCKKKEEDRPRYIQ